MMCSSFYKAQVGFVFPGQFHYTFFFSISHLQILLRLWCRDAIKPLHISWRADPRHRHTVWLCSSYRVQYTAAQLSSRPEVLLRFSSNGHKTLLSCAVVEQTTIDSFWRQIVTLKKKKKRDLDMNTLKGDKIRCEYGCLAFSFSSLNWQKKMTEQRSSWLRVCGCVGLVK